MATVPSFDVADEALQSLGLTPEQFAAEVRLAAAAFWYDRGVISQGIGARIAGLDRWQFMLGISRLEVSPFQETVEEIQQVLERGRAARGEHLPAHYLVPDRSD